MEGGLKDERKMESVQIMIVCVSGEKVEWIDKWHVRTNY